VEQILKIIDQNVSLAQEIIRRAVAMIPDDRACGCGSALAHAVITEKSAIPADTRRRLDLLLGSYLA
jgi:5'-methylthioadenosine phosphorylase